MSPVSALLSGLLAAAVMTVACAPPSAVPAPTSPATSVPAASPTAAIIPGTCEYLGARFDLPRGFTAQEQREPGQPIARVTMQGELGRHAITVSIIPREVLPQAGVPTPQDQTKLYFDLLRAAPLAAQWTDVREAQYPGPRRTYPVLLARQRISAAAVEGQEDHAVLLYLPEDLARGRYFYVFFWTDVHLAAEPPAPVKELERLVDSFTVLGPPAGATARGCASGRLTDKQV
jgi:hypothetical protein